MPVQPVHGAASLPGQLVPAVREQPQHTGVVIGSDSGQVGPVRGDKGNAAGVDVVGLAAMTGFKQPGPGCQGGGNIYDALACGDEALGKQLAEPVSSLGRPAPISLRCGPGQQLVDCRAGRSDTDRGELGQTSV